MHFRIVLNAVATLVPRCIELSPFFPSTMYIVQLSHNGKMARTTAIINRAPFMNIVGALILLDSVAC